MNRQNFVYAAGIAAGAAVGLLAAYLRERNERDKTSWFYGGMSGRDFRQITDMRVSGRELMALRAQPESDVPYFC